MSKREALEQIATHVKSAEDSLAAAKKLAAEYDISFEYRLIEEEEFGDWEDSWESSDEEWESSDEEWNSSDVSC